MVAVMVVLIMVVGRIHNSKNNCMNGRLNGCRSNEGISFVFKLVIIVKLNYELL